MSYLISPKLHGPKSARPFICTALKLHEKGSNVQLRAVQIFQTNIFKRSFSGISEILLFKQQPTLHNDSSWIWKGKHYWHSKFWLFAWPFYICRWLIPQFPGLNLDYRSTLYISYNIYRIIPKILNLQFINFVRSMYLVLIYLELLDYNCLLFVAT